MAIPVTPWITNRNKFQMEFLNMFMEMGAGFIKARRQHMIKANHEAHEERNTKSTKREA